MNATARRNPFRDVYDSPDYLDADRRPLRPYPLLLDLELTNACNLDCLQCWRHDMQRPLTRLDPALVRELLVQAAGRVAGVRFIGQGESLLHPDFADLAQAAKDLGLLTHLTTNGLLLTPELAGRIIEMGLDSVVFSFQGTDKAGYEFMRRNRKYDQLCATIREFSQLRGSRRLPYLVVNTTILDETPDQVRAFQESWKGWADEVGYWYTTLERIAHLEHVKELLPRQRIRQAMQGRVRCIEAHTKLSINSDGAATLCCNDYNGQLAVGRIQDHSLADLWTGERAARLRRAIASEHGQPPFCRLCSNKFNKMEEKDD